MAKRKSSYLDFNGYGSNNSYNKTANAYNYTARPMREEDTYEVDLRRDVLTRKKIVKRKKAVVYNKLIDRNMKMSKAFIIYAVIFFIGALSLLMLNAMYENKKNSVEALRKEIKTLRETNQDMRIELASSYDENEIALIATTRLGMGKPKPYQIRNIYVPKESYASGLGATTQKKEEVTLFDKITGFLLKN